MEPVRRVVLVGLPGAGKTSTGRLLAGMLGWDFVDVDEEIVRRSGRSVPEWFREDGEAAFRELEARLTAELCCRSDLVLAPGGGWAAQTGVLDSLPADTATIWLRVSPEEAIRRLRGSSTERPLLGGDDPLAALQALAAARHESYARAGLVLDVDRRPAGEIAEHIGAWLRRNTS